MTVHADTCEPKAMIGYKDKTTKLYSGGLLQKTLGDDQVIVRHLDSADYVFFDQDGHSLGIERKHGSDLTSSLNGRAKQANGNVRLLNQLVRMKAEYTHCGLLLEGTHTASYGFDDKLKFGLEMETGWDWLSMQMMLWGWEQDGLKIFWVPSHTDALNPNTRYTATLELLRGLNQRANTGCVLKGMKVKRGK